MTGLTITSVIADVLRVLGEPRDYRISSPSPSPAPPPASGSTLVDLANLALQITILVVAFVTVIVGIVAFFGVREARDIRKLSEQLRTALKESEATKSNLEKRLASFEEDFESLVLAAHLFNEGQTAYMNVEYDRAISFYEEALKLQPENSKIHIRIARCLTNKGMSNRAERHLRLALERHPDSAAAWTALATIKRYTNLSEAITFAEKAVDLDGSSVDAWNYLGLLLRDSGRYDESLSAHDEARKIAPLNAVTIFFQALVMLMQNAEDEARHAFYEAHAHALELQRTNRIKRMWALVIEWGYRRSIDTVEQEEAAVKIAGELAQICQEKRNRQAVISHILFYMKAKNLDPHNDLSLEAFPKAEVDSALNRQ